RRHDGAGKPRAADGGVEPREHLSRRHRVRDGAGRARAARVAIPPPAAAGRAGAAARVRGGPIAPACQTPEDRMSRESRERADAAAMEATRAIGGLVDQLVAMEELGTSTDVRVAWEAVRDAGKRQKQAMEEQAAEHGFACWADYRASVEANYQRLPKEEQVQGGAP